MQLLKQLWTRPAPGRVTFERTYVRELPLNPALGFESEEQQKHTAQLLLPRLR